ncbi:SDR family oxidoreductase [Amylibacter sp.]|nr:SDR family oxidoreductase [Amylibacter sp.]
MALLMSECNKRVLVLGAAGMLGNAIFRYFAGEDMYSVIGTTRSSRLIGLFPNDMQERLVSGIEINNNDAFVKLFAEVKPDVVINCIGMVKQLAEADDPLVALPINSLFPHRLAKICNDWDSRLIHMSTDCVFTGKKGMYTEEDVTDSQDLYGVSKRLGEVDYPNAVTLRTSIIGHELNGNRSLIDWFLSQQGSVRGYTQAVFSGLPTVTIAELIRDHVIPNPDLSGVYHVSAAPINKFTLLSLVGDIYGKEIEIIRDDSLIIDRSLDSSKFKKATGYSPAAWVDLVKMMYDFK